MDIDQDEMQEMVDDWYMNKVISSFLNYSWDNSGTISNTMAGMGYSVDESRILVEELEDNYYQVEVPINDSMEAIFKFKPLEEPHLGKFITLEPLNDLAQGIFNAML